MKLGKQELTPEAALGFLREKNVDLQEFASDPKVFDMACKVVHGALPAPVRWGIGEERVRRVLEIARDKYVGAEDETGRPTSTPTISSRLREDTQRAIELLALDKGQLKELKKREALIADVEARLSPQRTVKAALMTVGHGGPNGSDVGILLITDYGLHWKGETAGASRIDLPWDKLHRIEVVKARTGYDLVAESSVPAYELSFRLYDEPMVAVVREAIQAGQPLL